MSDQEDIPDTADNAPLAKICDDPDVILLVGPDEVPIGVDIRCLRRASKVFDTMFKPPWMERPELSHDSDSPMELELPEDDACAMHQVCCILHLRNDLVADDMPATKILEIAVVVDKYDMFTALKFAAGMWFAAKHWPIIRAPGAEAILSNLVTAAYLFRDAKEFECIAHRLMYYYSGTYDEIRKNSLIVDVLGPEFPVLLEERRARMKTELLQKLRDDAENVCEDAGPYFGDSPYECDDSECEHSECGLYEHSEYELEGCGYGTLRSERYTSILATHGSLNCHQGSVFDLVMMVEDLNDQYGTSEEERDSILYDLCPRDDCWRDECHVDGNESFTNKVAELKKTCGVSYDTIRAERAAARE